MNVPNTQSFLTLPYEAINASAVGSLQTIKIFADIKKGYKNVLLMNCIKHLAEYSKHLYIVPQSYP
jgi:hypothetical protein